MPSLRRPPYSHWDRWPSGPRPAQASARCTGTRQAEPQGSTGTGLSSRTEGPCSRAQPASFQPSCRRAPRPAPRRHPPPRTRRSSAAQPATVGEAPWMVQLVLQRPGRRTRAYSAAAPGRPRQGPHRRALRGAAGTGRRTASSWAAPRSTRSTATCTAGSSSTLPRQWSDPAFDANALTGDVAVLTLAAPLPYHDAPAGGRGRDASPTSRAPRPRCTAGVAPAPPTRTSRCRCSRRRSRCRPTPPAPRTTTRRPRTPSSRAR